MLTTWYQMWGSCATSQKEMLLLWPLDIFPNLELRKKIFEPTGTNSETKESGLSHHFNAVSLLTFSVQHFGNVQVFLCHVEGCVQVGHGVVLSTAETGENQVSDRKPHT